MTGVEGSHSDHVELSNHDTPGCHIADDADAYSRKLIAVDQYVNSKSGFALWAYLYDKPLTIWFEGGIGTVPSTPRQICPLPGRRRHLVDRRLTISARFAHSVAKSALRGIA